MTIVLLYCGDHVRTSAKAVLDEEHDPQGGSLIIGEIGKHKVVIGPKGEIETIIKDHPQVTRFLVLDTRTDMSSDINEGDVVFHFAGWESTDFCSTESRSIFSKLKSKYERSTEIEEKLPKLFEQNNLSPLSYEPTIHLQWLLDPKDPNFKGILQNTGQVSKHSPVFISGICSEDGERKDHAAMVAALIAKDMVNEFPLDR